MFCDQQPTTQSRFTRIAGGKHYRILPIPFLGIIKATFLYPVLKIALRNPIRLVQELMPRLQEHLRPAAE